MSDESFAMRNMIKMLLDEQEKLIISINELKQEQKRIYEEIKFQNTILSSLSVKNEILN